MTEVLWNVSRSDPKLLCSGPVRNALTQGSVVMISLVNDLTKA